MKRAYIINLAKGTLLSILVFFSVSFITILLQINPLHYYSRDEPYKLAIGFPFTYYSQFWMTGAQVPNSGWWGGYLLYDCVITWVVITGTYYTIKGDPLIVSKL